MKRVLSFILVIAICLSFFSVLVQALTPTYTVSESYKSGKYYTRLLDVELTGDQRKDIVNVALSQEGYHEGNSSDKDLSGESTGAGNYTEYNYWYPDKGQGNPWCAMFISWCARRAQIPESIIKNSVGANADSFGVVYRGRNTSGIIDYLPRKGDLIIFESQPYSSGHGGDHIGIVVDASEEKGEVYTIEGNCSEQVKCITYPLISSKIKGYAVPNYEPPKPPCDHTFSKNTGYCTKNCGREFPLLFNEGEGQGTLKNNGIPVLPRPYRSENLKRSLSNNKPINLIGSTYNAAGELWFLIGKDEWVFSENFKEYKYAITADGKTYGSGTTTPAAPQNVNVSLNNKNVSVSWGSTAKATSYDVYLVQSPWAWRDIKYSKTGLSSSTTSWTFNDIADGAYAAFVIARPNNDTVQSEWRNFTVFPIGAICTIQYNANGGTGAPASHSITKKAFGFENQGLASFYLSTTVPTRNGYTFYGWQLDNKEPNRIESPGQAVDVITSSLITSTTLTYYAQWASATTGTTTIQYNANGGGNAPSSHSVQNDNNGVAKFYLSSSRPIQSGYTFLGWRLENNPSNGTNNPGDSITFNTGNATSNTTLTYYAQWESATPDVPSNYKPIIGASGGYVGNSVKATIYFNNNNNYPITEFGFWVAKENGDVVYSKNFSYTSGTKEYSHITTVSERGTYYVYGYALINGVRYNATPVMAMIYDPW